MPVFLGAIDLTKNQLKQARVENLASAPSSPVLGQIWYDTTVNLFKYWNGTAHIVAPRLDQIPTPTAAVSMGSQLLTNVADPVSAQDAATRAYVLARKVTDLTAPTGSFSMNSQKITNLAAATTAGDATDKTYVDNAVEAARQGIAYKPPVRVVATSNVTVASPGTTIDGVTMAAADRVLLTAQSTGSENGIYSFVASGSPMTRAVDADVFGEVQDGTQVYVMAGTLGADTVYRQTATIASFTGQTWIVVATGVSYSWTAPLVNTAGTISISNAVPRQFAVSFGDGSSLSYVITHNLNTRNVHVTVRSATTPWAEFVVDNEATTVNTLTLQNFLVAPTTNQYVCYVTGFA